MTPRLFTFALLCAASLLALSGCSTTPFGSQVATQEAAQQQLAKEVTRELVRLYPPAKTRLALQHPALDVLGEALVKRLRGAGYAVQEFNEREEKAAQAQQTAAHNSKQTDIQALAQLANPPKVTVLPMRYLFDALSADKRKASSETALYRLELTIGAERLSRVYFMENGRFVAAGWWAYKSGKAQATHEALTP